MIKYSLRCADGHSFESWFASAEAFDTLAEAGRLSCAVCGHASVEKAMMAPRVSTRSNDAAREVETENASNTTQDTQVAVPDKRPLSDPSHPAEAAIAAFRKQVEANTEDVGRGFAAEARAIHEGRAPDRAIRGQAKPAEAKALLEDGVPVLHLPFPAPRQVN